MNYYYINSLFNHYGNLNLLQKHLNWYQNINNLEKKTKIEIIGYMYMQILLMSLEACIQFLLNNLEQKKVSFLDSHNMHLLD